MDVFATQQLSDPVSKYLSAEFVSLRQDWTAGEALEELRGHPLLAGRIVYFYAADAEGRLTGVLSTRALLRAQPGTPLRELMTAPAISVRDDAPLSTAFALLLARKLFAVPVVDREGRLVGVVELSLVGEEFRSMAQYDAEEAFQLIGLHLETMKRGGPWARFKDRFIWLLCNVGGGLLAALVAGLYEPLLEQAVVLALFIPIVLAMAESVSIQSMTITIETLHKSPPDLRASLRAVLREVAVSLPLGLALGLLIGLISYAWKHEARVAMVLVLAIALAMVTASLLGVVLPSLVRRLKVDPRIASGPIVLALTDLCALLFYLSLGAQLLLEPPGARMP